VHKNSSGPGAISTFFLNYNFFYPLKLIYGRNPELAMEIGNEMVMSLSVGFGNPFFGCNFSP
jgi:hypothetical protein